MFTALSWNPGGWALNRARIATSKWAFQHPQESNIFTHSSGLRPSLLSLPPQGGVLQDHLSPQPSLHVVRYSWWSGYARVEYSQRKNAPCQNLDCVCILSCDLEEIKQVRTKPGCAKPYFYLILLWFLPHVCYQCQGKISITSGHSRCYRLVQHGQYRWQQRWMDVDWPTRKSKEQKRTGQWPQPGWSK